MERLCVNCKHLDRAHHRGDGPYFTGAGATYICTALAGKAHPVTGEDIVHITADTMRMTLCGWSDPKFWEPKPKEAGDGG